MLNQLSIDANRQQILSPSHVRPDYALYNFANIPGTILNLFNIRTANRLPAAAVPDDVAIEKVIFLFVDAFGWDQYERFVGESAVLQRCLRDGLVSQLTSQFPSTTTAHVTTLHTNQHVGEHGMFEWNYYEPTADAVICPLFYSFAGDADRGTLQGTSLDPAAIFPRQTIYPHLTQQGIASNLFINEAYADSPYSQAINGDATHVISHSDFPQALDQLAQAVISQKGPAYFHLYWDKFDAFCHVYGPDSPEARTELRSILEAIEARLLEPLAGVKNTLLLIGADHGQDGIDPARTIYLNHLIPGIADVFKSTRSGRPIVPGGSCRSFFLYIQDESLEEAQQLLRRELNGTAQVLRVDRLIEQGYFGRPVSDRFLSRVGNLVIVPDQGESVWWYERGKFEIGWYGFHGGLAQDEMLIPLLALPL